MRTNRAAKKKGKHLGRPVVNRPEKFGAVYEKWKSGEVTAKRAMKQLGLSSSTFYRMAATYEREIM